MSTRPGPIPLNGEILAGESPLRGEGGSQSNEFVDAEFETVVSGRHGPAVSPGNSAANSAKPATDATAGIGMDMLTKKRATPGSQRGGLPFYFAGIAVAAMAFWVSGGHALFGPIARVEASAPVAATLRLGGISTQPVAVGSKRFILVAGHVLNEGTSDAAAPPVSIAVTGKNGDVQRYRLGSQETVIGAGERMPFSSRLDAPASGVGSVVVTLAGKSGT